ncbi:MAG: sugar ABC transporter ATP-binding protein, partial [bacterium]|nr:sugar ABC transporter ATP-binding protein [bacterium]
FDTPKKALDYGISIVFQDINLVPKLSVAENIFINRLPRSNRGPGLVGWEKLKHQAGVILSKLESDIDPEAAVNTLSVAKKQIVQIARAISYDPQLIIMDEPTAYLTEHECSALFEIIKQLKASGHTIVYISHKLDEVFNIADRITVLRDGKWVATKPKDTSTTDEIISLMVGRAIENMYPKKLIPAGEIVLKVEHVRKAGMFEDVSLEVRKGEIVGLYGLIGAGRTDLAYVLFGISAIDSGTICLEGKKVHIRSPQEAIKHGIGYLSEDRKAISLLPNMSVCRNITISNLQHYCNAIFTNTSKETIAADSFVQRLNIKTASIQQRITELSGGNQQKVFISRLLALAPKVLILDEPTQGVDVGAKSEIYAIIESLAEKEVGILMISSELPELLGIADRILVMREGIITGNFARNDADQENILKAASSVE